jgi:hypothetical protein
MLRKAFRTSTRYLFSSNNIKEVLIKNLEILEFSQLAYNQERLLRSKEKSYTTHFLKYPNNKPSAILGKKFMPFS